MATIWATLGKLGNFFTQTVRIGEVKLCPNGAELTEGKILKQDALSFGKKVSNFTSMNFELAKLPRFRQLFKYFCFKSDLVQHFQLSLTPNCSVTSKKLSNVYKSCPKMISLEKIKDFDTFTKIA